MSCFYFIFRVRSGKLYIRSTAQTIQIETTIASGLTILQSSFLDKKVFSMTQQYTADPKNLYRHCAHITKRIILSFRIKYPNRLL